MGPTQIAPMYFGRVGGVQVWRGCGCVGAYGDTIAALTSALLLCYYNSFLYHRCGFPRRPILPHHSIILPCYSLSLSVTLSHVWLDSLTTLWPCFLQTQVWLPKAATVQTRVDKGQAMPKKLQYVAGLRGAPEVKMNVVRLELDLGQPHQH